MNILSLTNILIDMFLGNESILRRQITRGKAPKNGALRPPGEVNWSSKDISGASDLRGSGSGL